MCLLRMLLDVAQDRQAGESEEWSSRLTTPLHLQVQLSCGEVHPSSGGKQEIQWSSGGTQEVHPSSEGKQEIHPSSGGTREIHLSSGGKQEIQWSSGGAREVHPSSGGSHEVQPSSGGTREVQLSSGEGTLEVRQWESFLTSRTFSVCPVKGLQLDRNFSHWDFGPG